MRKIKNIVALITPFNEDGSIDYFGFEHLMRFLLMNFPDGFFVNATTGEFTSLTISERKEVALFVLKNSSGIPVYMNVHSTVLKETLELCEFAKINGFSYIVSPQPFFLIPSQKGLIDYYINIAETAQLPTFIYNIPQLTGYSLSIETVKEISKHPLIRGIKVTYDNMNYLLRLVNEVKRDKEFEVYTGTEQLYVPLVLTGGDGGVMALANIALKIFNEVKQAISSNDLNLISVLHRKIARLTYIYSLTTSFGYAIKVALGLMGLPIKPYVRRPLMEDPYESEQFANILKEVGLL